MGDFGFLPSIRKNGYYIVPGAVVSAADIRRMENNMYKFLKEYVTGEDITRLARKFGAPSALARTVWTR